MISLYSLYDMQQHALAPWRIFSDITRDLLTHPLVPASHTQLGKSFVAGLEVLDSATARRDKPDWRIDHVAISAKTYPVEPVCVLKKPFCDLLHFRREGYKAEEPKILLVAPQSGHHATLLRGTVQALIQDHEVFVTDWIDASRVPSSYGDFGVDDYIDYLLDMIRFLGPDVHVMAVCQPAPLVLAAVSLLAQAQDDCQPKSMILMGGPVDTRAAPTQVTRFAEGRPISWFANHLISEVPPYYPGGGREVYPGFLQLSGFISMNPSRHFDAHLRMFHHLVQGDGDSVEAHRKFYDEYLAVMDVPAKYYLETVSAIFQKHLLPRGAFTWRGHLVEPSAITKTALLTVEGELDDISAPGQTLVAHELCSNLPSEKQSDFYQKAVGHYGIFNGRRWREKIKPRIAEFVREHG